jgi:CBS-domain-containing membrane protein
MQPIPVLIAIFIGYAGLAEAKQVDMMESVRGLNVRQAMVRTGDCILMDTPLSQIFRAWQASPMQSLPVVSDHGMVIGMLHLRDVQQATEAGKDPLTPASELIDNKNYLGGVGIDEQLETAIQRGGRQSRQIPVVDADGYLLGILDLDSMLMRAQLSSHEQRLLNESPFPLNRIMQPETLAQDTSSNPPHGFKRFDQTN